MDPTPCQSFEIAIDQRLHGALPEADQHTLVLHLQSCAPCRDYEASARSHQKGLMALTASVRADVDWERLEHRARRGVRSRVASLVFGFVVLLMVVPLSAWGFAPPGHRLIVAAVTFAAIGSGLGFRAWLVAQEISHVARLGAPSDLLAYHCAYLQRRLERIRRWRWLALAVITWSTIQAFIARPGPHARLVHVLLACLVAGVWIRTLIVQQPRLRRELAEIESELRA